MRISIVVLLVVAGCGKDAAPVTPGCPVEECPVTPACPTCLTPASSFVGEWWLAPEPCPDGYKLRGGPPPADIQCGDDAGHVWRGTWFHANGTPRQDDVNRRGEAGYHAWTEWYASGKPHYVGTETDRYLHWEQWREDGTLQAEAVFYGMKGDEWQSGTVTYWDATGTITKVEPYRGGKVVPPRSR